MAQPLFTVDVELKVPTVALSPSLSTIQKTLNTTARAILQVNFLTSLGTSPRWGTM